MVNRREGEGTSQEERECAAELADDLQRLGEKLARFFPGSRTGSRTCTCSVDEQAEDCPLHGRPVKDIIRERDRAVAEVECRAAKLSALRECTDAIRADYLQLRQKLTQVAEAFGIRSEEGELNKEAQVTGLLAVASTVKDLAGALASEELISRGFKAGRDELREELAVVRRGHASIISQLELGLRELYVCFDDLGHTARMSLCKKLLRLAEGEKERSSNAGCQ